MARQKSDDTLSIVERRKLYVEYLESLKGYATYKKVYKKYWYSKFKNRSDKEVLQDLGICLSTGMHPYLLGLCIIIMGIENDTIYNTKWQCHKDDAAGRVGIDI